MNLYPFLRRLRREAIPPLLMCEDEAVWSPTASDADGDPADTPSVPWRLTEQDVRFLMRRLHIDPQL